MFRDKKNEYFWPKVNCPAPSTQHCFVTGHEAMLIEPQSRAPPPPHQNGRGVSSRLSRAPLPHSPLAQWKTPLPVADMGVTGGTTRHPHLNTSHAMSLPMQTPLHSGRACRRGRAPTAAAPPPPPPNTHTLFGERHTFIVRCVKSIEGVQLVQDPGVAGVHSAPSSQAHTSGRKLAGAYGGGGRGRGNLRCPTIVRDQALQGGVRPWGSWLVGLRQRERGGGGRGALTSKLLPGPMRGAGADGETGLHAPRGGGGGRWSPFSRPPPPPQGSRDGDPRRAAGGGLGGC